jgi:hypothetical protein
MELLECEMRRPNPLSTSSLTISSTAPAASTYAICKEIRRRSELQLLRCRRFPYRKSALSSAFAREKKFENYLRSISAMPSNCFRAVIDKYSRAKNPDKTVLRLLSSLHQEESSLACQATLAAERDANS